MVGGMLPAIVCQSAFASPRPITLSWLERICSSSVEPERRSGSTLLEQILSSHDKVMGLGEANALWQTIAGNIPPTIESKVPAGHFRRLGDLYLEKLEALGWKKTP